MGLGVGRGGLGLSTGGRLSLEDGDGFPADSSVLGGAGFTGDSSLVAGVGLDLLSVSSTLLAGLGAALGGCNATLG